VTGLTSETLKLHLAIPDGTTQSATLQAGSTTDAHVVGVGGPADTHA
jgi:hypothetical protein